MSMLSAIRAAVNPASAEPAAVAQPPGRGADYAEGYQAAFERLSAALGAEGVLGDAKRMTAAFELAVSNASMSGEEIAAFVSKNVSKVGPAPESYEAHDARVAAAGPMSLPVGLARPVGRGGDRESWSRHAAAINETLGG